MQGEWPVTCLAKRAQAASVHLRQFAMPAYLPLLLPLPPPDHPHDPTRLETSLIPRPAFHFDTCMGVYCVHILPSVSLSLLYPPLPSRCNPKVFLLLHPCCTRSAVTSTSKTRRPWQDGSGALHLGGDPNHIPGMLSIYTSYFGQLIALHWLSLQGTAI